ncbi:MAG: PEP-CTERM sorting domain-containing protein, partial [Jaaginema sp. PMC 1079.18]|nr:PEP-CTERM sorting domain-containing protein [Jaaginema sp. PMC 1079.18]
IYHSFVTDSLRSLSISYSFQEYVKFEAARAQNLVVGTSSYEDVLQYRNSLNIDREIEKFIYQTGNSLSIFEPSSPFDMPSSENPFALLPESIENAYIENYFQKTPRFFQANFDSQYFTITNPLGRRIGYTNKGFFNEIEDVFYQSSNTHSSIQTSGSPAPITVADGKTFTIPYGTSLDNTNNNQNSLLPSEKTTFNIYFSNPENGEYQIDYIDSPMSSTYLRVDIPEPTSWISLLTSLFLGGWLRKKSRVRSKQWWLCNRDMEKLKHRKLENILKPRKTISMELCLSFWLFG